MRRRAATISAVESDARLPLPRPTTRSAGWARRSTRCSRGWRAALSASAHSSRTPATSCGRRWPPQGGARAGARPASPSEELAARVRSAAEEADRLVASPRTCWCWPAPTRQRCRSGPSGSSARAHGAVAAAFDARAGRGPRDHDRNAAAAGRLRRRRCACARRSTTWSRTRCATEPAPSASARAPRRRVELHVRDEGAGFPPGFLARAFERFARSDAGRAAPAPGSGWRSSRRSPRRTAAAPTPRTPDGGADVWIALPSPDGEPFIAVS